MKIRMIVNFLLLLTLIIGTSQIPERVVYLKYQKGSVQEIKVKAATEKKIIFIKCYTKWCSTCKWMQKTTLSDQKVAQYFNTNFINYKLNMEKNEGISFKDSYQIKAYPTFIFLNADGEVLHRFEGTKTPEELVELGKEILGSSH